jgi:hypothetical protein
MPLRIYTFTRQHTSAQRQILPKSLCCQSHCAAKVTVLPKSLCCQSHCAAKVTVLPKSPCCQSHCAANSKQKHIHTQSYTNRQPMQVDVHVISLLNLYHVFVHSWGLQEVEEGHKIISQVRMLSAVQVTSTCHTACRVFVRTSCLDKHVSRVLSLVSSFVSSCPFCVVQKLVCAKAVWEQVLPAAACAHVHVHKRKHLCARVYAQILTHLFAAAACESLRLVFSRFAGTEPHVLHFGVNYAAHGYGMRMHAA